MVVFVVLAFAFAGPVLSQENVEPETDIKIKMRDGVTTVADLWRPKNGDETFPVILIRTPYGKGYEQGQARAWSDAGFGVLVQSVRGRDGSEGTWIPWENEAQDGYDTIEWMTKQPWCSGRIGMMGGSYLGHVQILAATMPHPELDCIVPLSPGSDGFSDVPFSGGIPALTLMGWLHSCRGPKLDLTGSMPRSAQTANLRHFPISRLDKTWLGYESRIWQHWTSVNSLSDMPGIGLGIWDRLAKTDHKVPAFHIDGVWDHESMATRRNWEQFSKNGGQHQYLIFGPWPHEPNVSTRFADVEYGEKATVKLTAMRKHWYDHWLSGEEDHQLKIPKVQIFATGANRWVHSNTWPLENSTRRKWYFDDLHMEPGDRYATGLFEQMPHDHSESSWVFDPTERVPGNRNVYFNRSTKLWFKHSDQDALVIATEPFSTDTLLCGPANLELTVSSSARDTDLFALIVEISPEGQVRAIQRQAQLRLRYREGFDRAVPLEPGKPTKVDLPLGLFAHRFEKGSRLGVAIRSDWFPWYGLNLGTMEPNATAKRGIKQENRLISGPANVSALYMYQLPLSELED